MRKTPITPITPITLITLITLFTLFTPSINGRTLRSGDGRTLRLEDGRTLRSAPTGTVGVMTWNIRFNNPGDGINAWPNRNERVFSMISAANPDVLCMQEVLHQQVLDLERALPAYHWVGAGRDNGDREGEYVPVFYKKDRFKLLRTNNFWLSDKPDQPGIIAWDAACTRMVTWVLLQDIASGDSLYVFNTHFDHVGKMARINSAHLILDAIQRIAQTHPVILTGDFNVPPESEAYKILIESDLSDARTLSKSPPAGPEYTFTGFDSTKPHGDRIDYIFVQKITQVLSYTVNDDKYDRWYPSDHLPVLVTIEL